MYVSVTAVMDRKLANFAIQYIQLSRRAYFDCKKCIPFKMTPHIVTPQNKTQHRRPHGVSYDSGT